MPNVRPKPSLPRPRLPDVRLPDLWIGLLLVAAIFAVYSQVRTYGFVQYDDPTYVVDNPHVRGGLSAEGLAWAFTSEGVDNWFPLTWLSHMIDCQLFGLASGWHHPKPIKEAEPTWPEEPLEHCYLSANFGCPRFSGASE